MQTDAARAARTARQRATLVDGRRDLGRFARGVQAQLTTQQQEVMPALWPTPDITPNQKDGRSRRCGAQLRRWVSLRVIGS